MKEKTFKNIFANIMIALTVLLVFAIGFTGEIAAVMSGESDNKPYYIGNTSKKNVSLMVNVYWGTEFIEPMLKTLEENNVKATFFVGGSWVTKNDKSLLAIHEKGHEIGNHGYLHLDHRKLDKKRNVEEIFVTQGVIENLVGIRTTLFAPPSGSFSKLTLEAAAELGYKTVMWSADTIDWRDQNETLIYNRVMKKLTNGALVLMHPTKSTSQVLDKLIKDIKQQGYNLVTVSENIA